MAKPLPKSIGPWGMLWRRLRKNRVATTGATILFFLYVGACFAGFLSPYHYDVSNRDASFVGPMILGGYELVPVEVPSKLEDGKQVTTYQRDWRWFRGGVTFFDDEGSFTLWPHVHALIEREYEDEWGDPEGSGLGSDMEHRVPLVFFPGSDEPHEVASLFGWFPLEGSVRLFGVVAPAEEARPELADGVIRTYGVYLFGTDQRGRDIYSRLLFGGQISLSVGILGIFVSMTLAMILGGIAGYFGGLSDFLMMRSVEVIMAIPGLYLILVLRYMLPPDLSSRQTYLLIVLILAFVGWASNSRVIRGMVLSIRENDYVVASRALGQRSFLIILRHILPNAISYVIVTSTLFVPFYILGEVSLSFLGLGIQDPESSWGLMLRDAQEAAVLTENPWIIAPGIAVFVAVLAFNFLGDGLRDAADPRAVVSRQSVEVDEDEDEGEADPDRSSS